VHGAISPVGGVKDRLTPRANVRCAQNNILVTRDGQACLGDFAIVMPSEHIYQFHHQETLRYMAPECIVHDWGTFVVHRPSKKSDVYSLAMTSFSVCAFGNRPAT